MGNETDPTGAGGATPGNEAKPPGTGTPKDADLQRRKLLAEIDKAEADARKAKRDNAVFYRLVIPGAAVIVALSQAAIAYVSVSQTIARGLDEKRRLCTTTSLEVAKFSFERVKEINGTAPDNISAKNKDDKNNKDDNEVLRNQYATVNGILATLPDNVKIYVLQGVKPYVPPVSIGPQIDGEIERIKGRLAKEQGAGVKAAAPAQPAPAIPPGNAVDRLVARSEEAILRALFVDEMQNLTADCREPVVDFIAQSSRDETAKQPTGDVPGPQPSQQESATPPAMIGVAGQGDGSRVPDACDRTWTVSVYPQIINPDNRQSAQSAIAILKSGMKGNFSVSAIELVPLNKGIGGSVRYYYMNQKEEADNMAACLSALPEFRSSTFKALYIGGQYSNLPKGRMEVWFPGQPSLPPGAAQPPG